ncbi:helix-turn-helix domain-containing protein [Streptomyces sp. 900116325]
MRARMVQLTRSGQRVPAVADTLGRSARTVRRWWHRFNCRCGA